MYFEGRKANYDKSPMITIDGFKDNAVRGYDKILQTLHKTIRKSNKQKIVIVIDYYHGVIAPYGKSKGKKIATIKAYVRI